MLKGCHSVMFTKLSWLFSTFPASSAPALVDATVPLCGITVMVHGGCCLWDNGFSSPVSQDERSSSIPSSIFLTSVIVACLFSPPSKSSHLYTLHSKTQRAGAARLKGKKNKIKYRISSQKRIHTDAQVTGQLQRETKEKQEDEIFYYCIKYGEPD